MMFIKHGDAQPIRHVIEAPEVIEESAKEALEKAKQAAQEIPTYEVTPKDFQRRYSLSNKG